MKICACAKNIEAPIPCFSDKLKVLYSLPSSERLARKHQQEDKKFDPDYYLENLYGEESVSIRKILSFPSSIVGENIICSTNINEEDVCNDFWQIKYGTVDILYAYLYEIISMSREDESPSLITVIQLSSVLSWLFNFTSDDKIKDVIISNIRRSLCYPFYRNWELALVTLKDICKIIASGPIDIVKFLIKISSLLENADEDQPIWNDDENFLKDCSTLNLLYIKPLINFYNGNCDCSKNINLNFFCLNLAKAIKEISIDKSEVGFYLGLLEMLASLVLQEEKISLKDQDFSIPDIVENLYGLDINSSPHSKIPLETIKAAETTVVDLEDVRNKVRSLKGNHT